MNKMMSSVLLFLLASGLLGQEKRAWHGFPLDLHHLEARIDSFHMFIDGKKVGSWRWRVVKSKDKIVFKDISILDGRVREDAEMEVDLKTLERYAFRMIMTSQTHGWKISNDIRWQHDHAQGETTREDGKGGVHTVAIDSIYTDAVPRGIFVGLLPAMKLQTGQIRELRVFSALSGRIWEMQFEVRPPETVKVPAGEFETVPVALLKRGAHGVSNIFYLTQTPPRRIVKVDVLEQNMTIELLKR